MILLKSYIFLKKRSCNHPKNSPVSFHLTYSKSQNYLLTHEDIPDLCPITPLTYLLSLSPMFTPIQHSSLISSPPTCHAHTCLRAFHPLDLYHNIAMVTFFTLILPRLAPSLPLGLYSSSLPQRDIPWPTY